MINYEPDRRMRGWKFYIVTAVFRDFCWVIAGNRKFEIDWSLKLFLLASEACKSLFRSLYQFISRSISDNTSEADFIREEIDVYIYITSLISIIIACFSNNNNFGAPFPNLVSTFRSENK